MRLVFALSVVYMHSVRLLDGDNHREIVQRLFGIRSEMGYGSGDLAVDGFLAMSGYFTAATWARSGGWLNYLRNRVLRIYPGFVVASVLSQTAFVFVAVRGLGPWVHEIALRRRLFELSLLQFPTAHFPFHVGAWHVQDLPPVDAPLWVVAHEARCYLLAALVGILGMRMGPRWGIRAWWCVLGGAIALVLSGWEVPRFPGYELMIGQQTYWLRYTACFASGCLFFAYQDRILPWERTIPVTAAIFALCLAHESWLPVAIPIVLPFLVLQIGMSAAISSALPRPRLDLSFGIFLYAWPTQILLLHLFPRMGLPVLFPLAAASAAALSWASLVAVERPFLRLRKAPQGTLNAPSTAST
jgi:peptidoglycan/LPS O-acetylase OafA/YrhL